MKRSRAAVPFPETRKSSRIAARRPLLLDLPTELLDHALAFLWPDNLQDLVHLCASCKRMYERLESIGSVVLERLGNLQSKESLRHGTRIAKLAADVIEAREAMSAALANDVTNDGRSKALSKLKGLDPMVIAVHAEPLLQMLQDANASARVNAIHTLRPLGAHWNGAHVTGALVERLSDDNPWARVATFKTLEGFDSSAVAPHVTILAAQLATCGSADPSADRMVRQASLRTLRTLLERESSAPATRNTVAALLPELLAHSDDDVRTFAHVGIRSVFPAEYKQALELSSVHRGDESPSL